MIEMEEVKKNRINGSDSGSDSGEEDGSSFEHSASQPLLHLEEEDEKKVHVKWSKKLLTCLGFNKPKPDRTIFLSGTTNPINFPNNTIRNQKYYMVTFVPLVLFNQFKFFFNMFFLVIALTQFVTILKVGFMFTYVAPLVFVLAVTMLKEAWDDFQRYRRDKELNEKTYYLHTGPGEFTDIQSQNIKVGDIIKVKQNERIPADMILLYTTEEENANVFIRTDQLDGETDWKLRKSVGYTQTTYKQTAELKNLNFSSFLVEPPSALIYNFKGKFSKDDGRESEFDERITLEHTLWSNTVLASTGYVLGLVIYTGKETRAQMNSKSPSSKVGLIDLEINFLAKVLFMLMVVMAATIVILNGFHASWYINFFRFILLLCSIIPISLRVNLDLAKIYYSY